MNNKRILSLLIIFVLLLSSVQALAVGNNEIDYTEFVELVKDKYELENNGKEFDTPTPIFNATINGETYIVKPFIKPYKAGEEQIRDNNLYQDSTQIEPHITIPVGAEISLEDISLGGDGRSIRTRDWQIYKRDTDYKEYDRITSSSKNINNIKADKEGYILVFLNVADDLKYEGYSNWSDKGNWREERITDFSYKGHKVTGWYFTVLKIEVTSDKKPMAEFEIHYKGENCTDNKDNPAIVEKYPITVELKDKSISEKSKIVDWEWQVLRNDKWETFSKEQNPDYTLVANEVNFRLKVIDKDGAESEFVEHSFYSKTKTQYEDELGDKDRDKDYKKPEYEIPLSKDVNVKVYCIPKKINVTPGTNL